MSKQYLRKIEYLGFKEVHYSLQYGRKAVLVMMHWASNKISKNSEYVIVWARVIEHEHLDNYKEFPYKKMVSVIDKIEELLK